MRKITNTFLVIAFVLFTLIGALFGVSVGVSYSHFYLAIYTISIPIGLLLIFAGIYKFKTKKITFFNASLALSALVYSALIGGGYLNIINSFGINPEQVVSGPVINKEQSEYRSRISSYIEFEDIATKQLILIEVTSHKYRKIRIGSIYSEKMYKGRLGLLYRKKN